MNRTLFTSESVTEGHPDKLCDRISDSILDACLALDPEARVACETLVKGFAESSRIILAGEITLAEGLPAPDYEAVARQAALEIGYTRAELGMDARRAQVETLISTQSRDIAQGVDADAGLHHEQGAGDQGLMFGYASDETDCGMPLPIHLAHGLTRRLAEVRRGGILPWVRPDGKSQVSVRYENGRPLQVETVVVSTQHDPEIDGVSDEAGLLAKVREGVIAEVIEAVIPAELRAPDWTIHVNPTGKFVIGGPWGDAGLTGRKIIVDTYGGMGRHGGGAFSGKDPSKVDRSAAYACRWVARNLVAAGAARRVEIQVAYAIGVARPVSISVNTFGTAQQGWTDAALEERIREAVDLRPAAIIAALDLKRPLFAATAAYGHFGREGFSWERLDLVDHFRR
jgi:S-adenosylmethionine synthetase